MQSPREPARPGQEWTRVENCGPRAQVQGARVDAIFYLLDALRPFRGKSPEESQEITFEIGMQGQYGGKSATSRKDRGLRSLPRMAFFELQTIHLGSYGKPLNLNLLKTHKMLDMFCEYIHAALSKATYEIIEDEEPFYGEIPELRGVWAIGKTLEECRENLRGVVEGWIALRLRLGLAIPPIGGYMIETPSRVEAVV